MISVIIPTYNDEHIVGRAIHSALMMDGPKEIIVIDDGSTVPVTNKWNRNQVKLIRHETNKGLSAALNTGIEASTYDRFVICAADDELHPAYIALTAPHTNVDIVSVDMQIGHKHLRAQPGSVSALMRANCHSYAALIRKDLWRRIGGYKVEMNPSWEDWEFFLNAAKNGATWHHVHAPLHRYNRSKTGRDAQAQGKDYLLRGKMEGFHPDLYGEGRGLVTFVIPCYEQEQYLTDALNSIYDQIYPHVNVVVIDDGSPGDIMKVLRKLDVRKETVVIRQENKHLSGARNRGISEALNRFKSQYLVMLDADDKVTPDFIELTMSEMEMKHYIYTDLKFFGDAYHDYELPEYRCELLTQRHLHPCTFLAESKLFQDVYNKRQYYYDESMKQGYEDWEFAAAVAEAGYCGKRIAKPLFRYRYHQDGSMRTQATEINNELVRYIKSKHSWMSSKEASRMPCGGCGKSRYVRINTAGQTGGLLMQINVPNVGVLDAGAPIQVEYHGSTTSKITKIGQAGQIYVYSGNQEKRGQPGGPIFTAWARDAHLFVGPFTISAYEPEPEPEPVLEVVTPEPVKPAPASKIEVREQKIQEKLAVIDELQASEDDLTEIKGVGAVSAKKLKAAGFSAFESVEAADPEELALILNTTEEKAKGIISEATKLLDALEKL